MATTFSLLNWNIGGAKYLELPRKRARGQRFGRDGFRARLNKELRTLVSRRQPDVVTLHEIVRYGPSPSAATDIIDPIPGYRYYPFPLIDTERVSARPKWVEVREKGGWLPSDYFAQGNAFLIRKDLPHYPVLALPKAGVAPLERGRHFVEHVALESGLYFGDRDTEPRAALVAHFVLAVERSDKPLDVFVVNTHLTTLRMERTGIPNIDMQGSLIRREQLGIIFDGIVSRYNCWREERYQERRRPRPEADGETTERHPPIWILAGDFNFTEHSPEHRMIEDLNFIDLHPNKGMGTKAKGLGNDPTLTVDYIFAGPSFISLDPVIVAKAIIGNDPADRTVKVSDHYPLFAEIPLRMPD
jgi:endonuclease/exonuclease/phosphatase family metal-dependent hydrolase